MLEMFDRTIPRLIICNISENKIYLNVRISMILNPKFLKKFGRGEPFPMAIVQLFKNYIL